MFRKLLPNRNIISYGVAKILKLIRNIKISQSRPKWQKCSYSHHSHQIINGLLVFLFSLKIIKYIVPKSLTS